MKPLGGCEASDDREAFLGDQCNVWTVSNGNLLQIVRLHFLGVWQNPGVHFLWREAEKSLHYPLLRYAHTKSLMCISEFLTLARRTNKTRYGMARPLRATLIFCWCLVMSKFLKRFSHGSLLNFRAKGLSGKKHLPGYIHNTDVYYIHTNFYPFPFPNMSDFTWPNFQKKIIRGFPRVASIWQQPLHEGPEVLRVVEFFHPKETTGVF